MFKICKKLVGLFLLSFSLIGESSTDFCLRVLNSDVDLGGDYGKSSYRNYWIRVDEFKCLDTSE